MKVSINNPIRIAGCFGFGSIEKHFYLGIQDKRDNQQKEKYEEPIYFHSEWMGRWQSFLCRC